jgi:dynein heavy chain
MPHKAFNMRVDLTKADPKNKRLYPPFLSLDIFDNTEYDCRNSQEWLNLGVVKGKQRPVPGKALLSLTGKDVADPDRYNPITKSGCIMISCYKRYRWFSRRFLI